MIGQQEKIAASTAPVPTSSREGLIVSMDLTERPQLFVDCIHTTLFRRVRTVLNSSSRESVFVMSQKLTFVNS